MKELKESPTPIFNSPQKTYPKNPDSTTPSPSHALSSAVTPSPNKTPEEEEGPRDDTSNTDINYDSYGGGFEGDDNSLHGNDGNVNGASQPLDEFPLTFWLRLPLFAPSNKSMKGIDLGRMNRDNLLREIVQLKD